MTYACAELWIADKTSGLRRFPNFSPFAGITNIPFMILAHGGARSKHLSKLHQKEPV